MPSRIFAPSGMIPTAAEKEVQKQWDELPRSARQIRWYWASLMGDNHYRRYVEHRGRTHPGEPVLHRTGVLAACATTPPTRNPQARCC